MLMFLLAVAIIIFAIFGYIFVRLPPRDSNVCEVIVLQTLQDAQKTQPMQQIENEETEDGDTEEKLWHDQDRLQKILRNKRSSMSKVKTFEEVREIEKEWTKLIHSQPCLLEDIQPENKSPIAQPTETVIVSPVYTISENNLDNDVNDDDDPRLASGILQALIQETILVPPVKKEVFEVYNVTAEESQLGTEMTHRARGDKKESEIHSEDDSRDRTDPPLVADQDTERIKAEKALLSAFYEKGLRERMKTVEMSMEETLNSTKQEKNLKASLLDPEPASSHPDICTIAMKIGEKTYNRRFLMSDTIEDVYNYAFSKPETPPSFEITTGFPKKYLYCHPQCDPRPQTLKELGFSHEQIIHIIDQEKNQF